MDGLSVTQSMRFQGYEMQHVHLWRMFHVRYVRACARSVPRVDVTENTTTMDDSSKKSEGKWVPSGQRIIRHTTIGQCSETQDILLFLNLPITGNRAQFDSRLLSSSKGDT